MLFYFSGTGNALAAARCIATAQNTELRSIAREMDQQQKTLAYTLQDDELLGIVCPVYAWAPPRIVLDFISRLKIEGGRPYVFALSVCGGEGGLSVRILQKALAKKNVRLDSAFTLTMPNNYLIGVDVDPEALAEQKRKQADEKLAAINTVLQAKTRGVFDLCQGSIPGLKSYFINPFFNQFALRTSHFFATDRCTGCKICEQVCPVHSIKVNSRPVWQKACTHCLACINSCPVEAIEYGKMTVGRARYLHPDLKKQLWAGQAPPSDARSDLEAE